MGKTTTSQLLWRKASVASLPAIYHASHLEQAQNSWLSPNTRRDTTDYYSEGIQRCCLCLQKGIKKTKAQVKPKLAKVDKDKEKDYSKDIGNTRMPKKTLGPLFSDTGESGGCLPSPTLERTVWIITKVKMGICVRESNKQNCLTGYRPKPGHVTREQEACQLH